MTGQGTPSPPQVVSSADRHKKIVNGRAGIVLCAVLIALVLAGDVAAAVVISRRNRAATPAALKEVRAQLEDFVERSRGLNFRRKVDIVALDDPSFEAALLEVQPEVANPARQYAEDRFLTGFLKAMGLVRESFHLADIAAAANDAVLGLYDFARRRILVRADLPDPLLRRVVVHELTHALDDQHFDLDSRRFDLRTETFRAFQALVEGDAVRVDTLYRDQLSPEEQAQAEEPAEGIEGAFEGATGFLALLTFPYEQGPAFVRALAEGGGNAAVDAAFADPPRTSEHILHADAYRAGPSGGIVARPATDGRILGLGMLGELGLRAVLAETVDAPTAAAAAAGWGADRWVSWSDNERICVRVNLAMDTPSDTAEAVAALRRWAAAHPGAQLDTANPSYTTITRCV